jgi:glucose/arabinose dehydrogenase
VRQPVALAWHAGHLFAAMNSRDSLDTLWPGKFTAQDNATRPLEPLLQVDQGSVFGWPYCYFDGQANDMVLAPEYGGDGKTIGRCAQFQKPVATYPAHFAPVGLMFYTGTQFPAKYRGGAFISFHGSWNRAPAPQDGYNITYQPFAAGKPSGKFEVFADGFKGSVPFTNPNDAPARPDGTGQGPDGSLYITDSAKGKIWRVIYRGTGK